jgi:hypothetical protein
MFNLTTLLARLKALWPYAVAVLLPGGSLIAIGLWFYQRHKAGKPLFPFGRLFSRPAIEGFFFRLRSEADVQP